MQTPSLASDPVDVKTGDGEEIQSICSQIQQFAALIAVSTDWIVTHMSTNFSAVTGCNQHALGQPLDTIMPRETMHSIRSGLGLGACDGTITRKFGLQLNDGRGVDMSLHATITGYIIEIEPAGAVNPPDDIATVQNLISRLPSNASEDELCQQAARSLKVMTGFNRAMVYRLCSDDRMTVWAEAAEHGQESYLGLRFPAGDISRQSGALHLGSALRLIEDVGSPPVKILSRLNGKGQTLDLSLSISRAPHDAHRKHLRSMGARACMAISLVRDDKLWGLLVCHHASPRRVDFRIRSSAELFAKLFSYELTQRSNQNERAAFEAAQNLHNRLLSQVAEGGLMSNVKMLGDEIGNVIPFDGFAVRSKGLTTIIGETPPMADIVRLESEISKQKSARVFASGSIIEDLPGLTHFHERTAGVLALPISPEDGDYLFLFRKELPSVVASVCHTEKVGQNHPLDTWQSPKKSQENRSQLPKKQSPCWTANELRAAEAVRSTLIEAVLKVTKDAARDRAESAERQEMLVAELNHRIRNILSMLQSLLQSGTSKVEDFGTRKKAIAGRVAALARAHDLLTSPGGKSTSLFVLIRSEIDAFSDLCDERVRLCGPDPEIDPSIITTLVLVVHELITNSAKYGALSVTTGTLEIETQWSDEDGLSLIWKERNGPSPGPVEHRGLGLAVIEKAISHEMGGSAKVELGPEGLRASFQIPAQQFSTVPVSPAIDLNNSAGPKPHLQADDVPEAVLLVEDNAVIALGAVGILESIGVRSVFSTSNIETALNFVSQNKIDIALLDINLGDATSESIAAALETRGIPFFFVSGYSEVKAPEYSKKPVLLKPYTAEELIGRMRDTWQKSRA